MPSYMGACALKSLYLYVCGVWPLQKSKKAWLDTLIKDMDTWPDNNAKLFKYV